MLYNEGPPVWNRWVSHFSFGNVGLAEEYCVLHVEKMGVKASGE
jgi:hypothetical protein